MAESEIVKAAPPGPPKAPNGPLGGSPAMMGDPSAPAFGEIGVSGLKVASGYIIEEFQNELRGANAVRIYRQMSEADSTVNAVLTAIGLVLRAVDWRVEPADDSGEAEKEAEFVESLLDDMSHPFTDVVGEAMSMLVYGWSALEIVLKRRNGPDQKDPAQRSKFTDGRIGLRKLPLRSQDSLLRWEMQDDGGISGLWQLPPMGGGQLFIPVERLLLFRTTSAKNNPEGRALALDTPILTKDGWKTMGSVEVGDAVYGSDGRLTYVSAKSPVWKDRECYEVQLNTGEVIVADAEHLWSVSTANDRNHTGRPPRVLTTREMYEGFKANKTACFSPGVPTAVDQPRQWLPLDPYVLGYWLGDGDTHGGGITVAPQDWPSLKWNVEAAGFLVSYDSKKRAYIKGLLPKLRQAGVYRNKHIPEAYLRGSIEQRLALLQGLMDSDGSSPIGRRPSYFCNSNPQLIKEFKELVASLGAIPMQVSQAGSDRPDKEINGRAVKRTKTSYRIIFWAPFQAHRLSRKAAAQTRGTPGHKTTRFFIRDIRPVERRDTVCIEVAKQDHMFLVGRTLIPTHNSILRAAYEPWYYKKSVVQFEAIGIERELAGLPVASIPSEFLAANATADKKAVLAAWTKIARDLKFNQQGGIVKPSDVYRDKDGNPTSAPMFEVKLLTTGGQRAIQTGPVVERHEKNIARSALADFMMLGDQKGSYALSKNKSELFLRACESYLNQIAEVLNRFLIPRIWNYNNLNRDLMPELKPGRVAPVDLAEFGAYLQALAASGAPIWPNQDLLEYSMEIADAPAPPEDAGVNLQTGDNQDTSSNTGKPVGDASESDAATSFMSGSASGAK